MAFEPVDWRKLFAIDLPILELVLRASIMYLLVFVFVRISGRRSLGQLGMLDFIFVLMLAVAADRAMMGDQTSIGSGFVMVATLAGWNFLLNWAGYRIQPLQRLTTPAPIPIIENGKMNRRNMRREFLTEEELLANLREQGCDDPTSVKTAYIEGDGAISVIRAE